jgi:hypothetical protein
MHLKLDLGAIMSSDQPLQFFRSLHQNLVMLNVPQLHVVHGTFRHSWAIPNFPPVSGRMMCPDSGDWCRNQVANLDAEFTWSRKEFTYSHGIHGHSICVFRIPFMYSHAFSTYSHEYAAHGGPFGIRGIRIQHLGAPHIFDIYIDIRI